MGAAPVRHTPTPQKDTTVELGIVGILVVILLIVLIVYFVRRA
ncbi:hypothetical protein PO878_06685 [Iamia majanohamensis]|uniref:Uncharacterized protein n=1 Tax=Iamia majanohamensis TaxID=467976 RepID=A0AAE9YC28_9ACTN|nr:hypothetical protein [Iamia majanohamensis]WCO68413.1 hypothetical protein PO878_06685 [Iamia majanohamensis]